MAYETFVLLSKPKCYSINGYTYNNIFFDITHTTILCKGIGAKKKKKTLVPPLNFLYKFIFSCLNFLVDIINKLYIVSGICQFYFKK